MDFSEEQAAAVVKALCTEEAEIAAILAVIEKPRELFQPEVMRAQGMLKSLKERYRSILRSRAKDDVSAGIQAAIRHAYVEIRVRPGSHPCRHPWGTHLRSAISELIYYRERLERTFPGLPK